MTLNNSELVNTDRLEVGDIKYTSSSAIILLYTSRDYDNVEGRWAKAVKVYDDQGKKDARFLMKSTTALATNTNLVFHDITPIYFMCSHGPSSTDKPSIRSWDYWPSASSERLRFRYINSSGNVTTSDYYSSEGGGVNKK